MSERRHPSGGGLDPALERLLAAFADETGAAVAGSTEEFSRKMRARFERAAAAERASVRGSPHRSAGARIVELQPAASGRSVPSATRQPARMQGGRWMAWAAAAGLIALLAWAFAPVSQTVGPASGLRTLADGSLAPLDPARLLPGSTLEAAPGERVLAALDGGRVSVCLNGGSLLRIEAADRVRLERGMIWTAVRPGSGFFAIDTTAGQVIVLGTEFGVAADGQNIDVDLLRGAIEARSLNGSILRLTEGQRARIDHCGNGNWLLRDGPAQALIRPDWAREISERALVEAASLYFPSGGVPAAPGASAP